MESPYTCGSRTITLSLPPAASGPRSYEIVVGQGLLSEIGARAAKLIEGRQALLIIDDQLPGDLVRRALESLDRAGFEVIQARVRALELNKTLSIPSLRWRRREDWPVLPTRDRAPLWRL